MYSCYECLKYKPLTIDSASFEDSTQALALFYQGHNEYLFEVEHEKQLKIVFLYLGINSEDIYLCGSCAIHYLLVM